MWPYVITEGMLVSVLLPLLEVLVLLLLDILKLPLPLPSSNSWASLSCFLTWGMSVWGRGVNAERSPCSAATETGKPSGKASGSGFTGWGPLIRLCRSPGLRVQPRPDREREGVSFGGRSRPLCRLSL